jgi:hypothetical protein
MTMTDIPLQETERSILREHIIFLGTQLEAERKSNQQKAEFLKRLQDREDLGWAVSDEVRSLAYQLLIDDAFRSREISNA